MQFAMDSYSITIRSKKRHERGGGEMKSGSYQSVFNIITDHSYSRHNDPPVYYK